MTAKWLAGNDRDDSIATFYRRLPRICMSPLAGRSLGHVRPPRGRFESQSDLFDPGFVQHAARDVALVENGAHVMRHSRVEFETRREARDTLTSSISSPSIRNRTLSDAASIPARASR